MNFLIAASTLHLLLAKAPSLTREVFDRPGTYVSIPVGNDTESLIPQSWKVSPLFHFTSIPALRAAFRQGWIPCHTALGYDNERWPFTPISEQQHPTKAVRTFARIVHRNFCTYFQLGNLPVNGSPMGGARWAHAIDIQAQYAERDPTTYRQIVLQDAWIARKLNPNIQIFAGISTNPPPGTPVTLQELRKDILATKGVVNGYWFDIPKKGPYCPNCGKQNFQLAVRLLSWIHSHDHGNQNQ